MNDIITIQDVNGNYVPVHGSEIARATFENIKYIFGIDTRAILLLRAEYCKRGGNGIITEEDLVRVIFRDNQ